MGEELFEREYDEHRELLQILGDRGFDTMDEHQQFVFSISEGSPEYLDTIRAFLDEREPTVVRSVHGQVDDVAGSVATSAADASSRSKIGSEPESVPAAESDLGREDEEEEEESACWDHEEDSADEASSENGAE